MTGMGGSGELFQVHGVAENGVHVVLPGRMAHFGHDVVCLPAGPVLSGDGNVRVEEAGLVSLGYAGSVRVVQQVVQVCFFHKAAVATPGQVPEIFDLPVQQQLGGVSLDRGHVRFQPVLSGFEVNHILLDRAHVGLQPVQPLVHQLEVPVGGLYEAGQGFFQDGHSLGELFQFLGQENAPAGNSPVRLFFQNP